MPLLARSLTLDARLLVSISFIVASFGLIFLGVDKSVSVFLLPLGAAGALLAGAFYTLGATTPFAMVVILELMRMENPFLTAIAASLAAAALDCFLFWSVRSALETNARAILGKLRAKYARFSPAFPVFGFFVFGLPLPDELGLALLQMTNIRLLTLGCIVFLAKFATLLLLWLPFSGL